MKSKLIKYLGFIIVFLSISAFGHSQVTKLKTVSVSFKNLGVDGKWSEWEDESESSVLITFDESKIDLQYILQQLRFLMSLTTYLKVKIRMAIPF